MDTNTQTAPTLHEHDASLRREPDPFLLDAAVQLHTAALNAATAIAAGALEPGERRRADKVVRQIRAAARLIARGSRLDPAPVTATVAAATREAARFAARTAWPVHGVDADSRWVRAMLHELHAWRGHTACLAAPDR